MPEAFTSHIAVLTLDLHVPEAGSLKSKRQVIKSIKDRLRSQFNVSVAELGELDKWQRCVIGVTMIGNDKKVLNQAMDAVRNFVDSFGTAQLIDFQLELI